MHVHSFITMYIIRGNCHGEREQQPVYTQFIHHHQRHERTMRRESRVEKMGRILAIVIKKFYQKVLHHL